MKRTTFGIALIVLVLTVGCSDAVPTTGSATVVRGPADYTVVAKNIYRASDGNTSGRQGYYVTIVLFGAERETQVTFPCYSAAVLGRLLPADCR